MQMHQSAIGMFILMVLVFVLPSCATRPTVSPLQDMSAHVVLKDPQNPEYWVEYGRASMFSNNAYGAEMAFRRALQLNEQYLPAYKHLGMVLADLQRYLDAEKVYERALQIADKDSELWTAYGYCLVDMGNNKNAIHAFRKSIEVDTDIIAIISARLGLSAIFRKEGDEISAKHEFREAVKINPDIVKKIFEQQKKEYR